MNTRTLSLMSVLSFLAACFGRTSDAAQKPAVAEYPRFPATSVADVKFEPIALDSGFRMKSFFISSDKEAVYVLGYRAIGGENPDVPRAALHTVLRMFALDTKGTITHRLDITGTDDVWGSSMGMIGGELLLYTGDHFVVLDTRSFKAREKIPVWHDQHFPSKQDVELMTPDEQRDAYEPLLDAALKDCTSCRWLEWPSGKYFVFVEGARGKRAAWSPMTYADDVIAPLRERFAPIEVSMNPQVSTDSGGDNFTALDGAVKIHEEDILSGGTELDFPNYKARVVVQYALTMGPRVLHFSTSDKRRHDSRVGFADNAYLTTSDGSAWVRYMGILYRIE
ncbi:MAG: hypothetical protein ABIP93_21835 [Gemmatimonadaceae bacterium]